MIFLVQFGINKHHGLVHFCCSLKNLLVLIYSKLYSKLPILTQMKRNKHRLVGKPMYS